MKKTLIYLYLSLLTVFFVPAQNIKVRIFSGITFDSVLIKVNTGNYNIIVNKDTVKHLETGNSITISSKNKKGKLEIRKKHELICTSDNVLITGGSFRNSLLITPYCSKSVQRTYDDGLNIISSKGKIFLINIVDMENYIAGVVEAEAGGCSDNEEFFKAQSIISRTYAAGHINNHIAEGYNLCDDVHCQSYKGRATKTSIMKAAFGTRGSVIVDKKGELITATYHSNSGGATVNSGDLWKEQLPYLVSVTDSFSIKGTKAKWEYKIKTNEWLNFLEKEFNYPVNDSVARSYALNFSQDSARLVFFNKNITLRSIREKLGLRSTWFSITQKGETLIFKGRGYGHGVGLSQEGAIIMADKGYSYSEILNFYYKGILITKKDNYNLYH